MQTEKQIPTGSSGTEERCSRIGVFEGCHFHFCVDQRYCCVGSHEVKSLELNPHSGGIGPCEKPSKVKIDGCYKLLWVS